MSSRRLALALLFSLTAVSAVASSGCGAEAVSLARGPRPYTESDYEDVYDRWTRAEEQFSWATMSDVLRVSATFESWEYRWAYVVRYCHDYSIDVTERDAMLRATLADSEQMHRFFVSLQGERFRESDLTGRLGAWRVLLVDDQGRQTLPAELQRVQRPTAPQLVYFPHITPHRASFRIAFPVRREDGTPTIPPGTTSVRLRFAGARGQVDLVWELRAEDVPAAEPETAGGANPLPSEPTSESVPAAAGAPIDSDDPAARPGPTTDAPTP